MFLSLVPQGTGLRVLEKTPEAEDTFICNAVFYHLVNDSSFWAGGLDLYNYIQSTGNSTTLSICFFSGPNMYTFAGAPVSLQMEGRIPLVLIRQSSEIVSSTRREYERNEMFLYVSVYRIAPDSLYEQNPRKFSSNPDFYSEMFDISAGGMCLVSQEHFSCNTNEYYLLEFSLGFMKDFLIPAKLVRKSDCPQASLYRHDYGFEFDFSRNPTERDRLIRAIFHSKMSALAPR